MTTEIQNFYKSSITRNWSATTGDFNVSIKPTISSGYLVVSPNNSTLREIIKYTATGTNAYGDFVTVSNISDRGLGGTTAQTHTIGEPVRMNITAQHINDIEDEIAAIIAGTTPVLDLTSGTSYAPASSLTQTITHGLSKTPKIIRLTGLSSFTYNTNSTINSQSFGVCTPSGSNHCVYIDGGNTGEGHVAKKSDSFAISLGVGWATGVVGNITSTTFDIVWTVGTDSSSCTFLWEAEA